MAMRDAAPQRAGWGNNRELEVDGIKLFAKSLLVTDLELTDPFGTRNIHELPVEYSYGMGSAGFRAGRELALHLKTTQWVLDGSCGHFPLLFHHRLLPSAVTPQAMEAEELEAHIHSWNGHASIRRLMNARTAATHEILVILEHIPHMLREWFLDKPGAAVPFVEQLGGTARFLSQHGVVHFDAHAKNILTDGETFYLTDFGLGMDRSFELSKAEQEFLRRHRHYDLGMILCGLLVPLAGAVRNLPEDTRHALQERYGDSRTPTLAPHVSALVQEGILDLPDSFIKTLSDHLDVFPEMIRFFTEIAKPAKSAQFQDGVIAAAVGGQS